MSSRVVKPVRFRRGRAPKACEVCHSRKVRCDMTENFPCTNCKAFSIECVPREGRNKRKAETEPATTPQSGGHSDPPAGEGVAGESVNSGTNASTSGSGDDSSLVDDSLLDKVRIKATAHSLSRAQPGRIKPEIFKEDNIYNVLKALLRGTSMLNNADEDELFLRVLRSHPNTTIPESAAMQTCIFNGSLLLPTAEVSDHLVGLYFTYVHPYVPVVNRRMFMDAYLRDRDAPSLLIRQAMFAAAARLSTHPDLMDSKNQSRTAALEFYHRAKALFDMNYENNQQHSVMAALILAQTVDHPLFINHNAFFWVRIGITIAQGMGYHRRKPGDPHTEQQIRQRIIWWSLYKRDISSSMAYWPSMISLEDCDVDMVSVKDFEGSEGPIAPGSPASVLANYFIQSVKLHEILALILRIQFNVGAERLRQMQLMPDATQCDRALAEWVGQLPSELDIAYAHDGDEPASTGSDGSDGSNASLDTTDPSYIRKLLYTEYYTVVCHSHRPQVAHLFRAGGGQNYPTWGIAFQAAHMILQLMEAFLRKKQVRKLPGVAVYACFSAIILLSFQQRASQDPAVKATVTHALDRFHSISGLLGQSHTTGSWVMLFTEELQKPRLASRIAWGLHQYSKNTPAKRPQTVSFPESKLPPPASSSNGPPAQYASGGTLPSVSEDLPRPLSNNFPDPYVPLGRTPRAPHMPQAPQMPSPDVHPRQSHLQQPQAEPSQGEDTDHIQKMFPPGDMGPPPPMPQFLADQGLDFMLEGSEEETMAPSSMSMTEWYDFLTKEDDISLGEFNGM